MSDLNTIEYVITDFDPINKMVRVEFKNDGWAMIPLVAPLPTTMEELDVVVRQFAAPVEAIEARQAAVDMSFITGSMNTPRVAERMSMKKLLEGDKAPVELPKPPETLEEHKAAKLAEIAAARYEREVGGFMTPHGTFIETDREAQSKIAGAHAAVQAGFITVLDWKFGPGVFVTLTAEDVGNVARGIAQHVQESFTWEKTLVEQVQAATTIEEVQAIELV